MIVDHWLWCACTSTLKFRRPFHLLSSIPQHCRTPADDRARLNPCHVLSKGLPEPGSPAVRQLLNQTGTDARQSLTHTAPPCSGAGRPESSCYGRTCTQRHACRGPHSGAGAHCLHYMPLLLLLLLLAACTAPQNSIASAWQQRHSAGFAARSMMLAPSLLLVSRCVPNACHSCFQAALSADGCP